MESTVEYRGQRTELRNLRKKSTEFTQSIQREMRLGKKEPKGIM